MKRAIVLTLMLTAVLLCSVPAFAAEEVLGTSRQTYILDMWHYSGAYWQIGNYGEKKLTISDSEMEAEGGLTDYLEASNSLDFAVKLPAAALDALNEGKELKWKLRARSISLSRLYDLSSLATESLSAEGLVFSVRPRFNIIKNHTLGDYVAGLNRTVPLVDKNYGFNIFSVYGNGRSEIQGYGAFDAAQPYSVIFPYIHPSMISGPSGALKNGYTVLLSDEQLPSDGYCIGQGTFADAGACGLEFIFPIDVVFYVETEAPPAPPDPGEPEEQEEPPETNVSVTAKLGLPPRSYVGHPVIAEDMSEITVNGETYGAARAYGQNMADAGIKILQDNAGTKRKLNHTKTELSFSREGDFDVRLTVRASGASDSDTESIEICPTPYVEAEIAGTRKQNRKQTLVIRAAQDPEYPLISVGIKIRDTESGESISLPWNFNEDQAPVKNSGHIKYRKPYDNGSDGYFVRICLDFLSKFDTERSFEYEITAVDEKGDSYTETERFTVLPDMAPEARISLEPSFIRNKGSDTAAVFVNDVSTADGDQLRRKWSWSEDGIRFSELPGLSDMSFGSLQNIKFGKTGVGPFSVKLNVTDVWTDDTLEEYIEESDYLGAETSADSEVINIAPEVSLGLSTVKSAEILLLAENREQNDRALAAKAEIKKGLLAEGISADIIVEDISDAAENSAEFAMRGLIESEFGFQGRWQGFWENGTATADEKRVYKAEALWTQGNDVYDCWPSQPFTIRAFDKNTLDELWRFTLAETVLKASDRGASAYYGHDAEGKYLYFVAGGKTLLLDKETGALAASLPFEFGSCNAMNDSFIYSFKNDGIYRISRSDASVKKLLSENLYAADRQVAQLEGKQCVLCRRGTEHFKLSFSPLTERLSYTRLMGTASDPGDAASTLLGIDTAGMTVLHTKYKSGSCVRVFNEDGTLYKKIDTDPAFAAVCPVSTASGKITGIAGARKAAYNDGSRVSVTLYKIYTDDAPLTASISGSDYPTEIRKFILGLEKPDGSSEVGFGANFDFVYGMGLPYNERFKLFSFTAENETYVSNGSSMAGGAPDSSEYSCRIPGTVLLTTAYNAPGSAYDRTAVFSMSESREDKTERLGKKDLSFDTEFSFIKTVGENFNAAAFSRQIGAEAAEGEKSLVIIGTAEDSFAAKRYELLPGTVYYYEYDTSAGGDVLSVEAQLEKEGTALSGPGVLEQYTEDFNDEELEPFFSYTAGELSRARYNMVSVHKLSGDLTRYGQIGFTIPDGYSGAYSFNYFISKGTGCRSSAHFDISKDGGAYRRTDNGTGGLCYSREPLAPGSYSIRGVLQAYAQPDTSQSITASIDIDDLSVMLFKDSGSYPVPGLRELETDSRVSSFGGETHVSGSFTTPGKVLSYGLFEGQHVSERIERPGKDGWTLNLPDGAYIPYLKLLLKSYPSMSYSSSGSEYPKNVVWTLTGENSSKSWISTKSTKAPDCFDNIGREYEAEAYGLSGMNHLKAVHAYDASSRIENADYFLTDPESDINPALEDGRFFIDGGRLYYEDIGFSGTALIKLNTGAENTTVSDLKLYTIQNGQKIYAENSSFRAESAARDWQANGATVTVASTVKELEEEPAMVFRKGEFVNQSFFYSDHENDPSKAAYFKYTHRALNDGLHPQSGKLLTDTIDRFYIDGRYLLQHWQYDSTGRAEYDLQSNVAEFVFYILGEAGGSSPWIEYISTDPASDIYDGESWSAKLGINDKDKDTLSLEVEIFHSSDRVDPACTYTKNGIEPDASGKYPEISFPFPAAAKEGSYDIIASVSDGSSSGMKNYRFVVKAVKSLNGTVTHTAAWETNRNAFNRKWFGITTDEPAGNAGWLLEKTDADSLRQAFISAARDHSGRSTPRLRYSNIFWPGEQLVLRTSIGGNIKSVRAELLSPDHLKQFLPEGSTRHIDLSPFTALLSAAGEGDREGEKAFAGALWNGEMRSILNTGKPLPLIVRFTALYTDAKTLVFEVPVIFDQDIGYLRLHRVF